MSQFVAASEVRAIAGGVQRQQVMDIVRGATFIGTLLLGWISLHPFVSLEDMQIGDVGTGNEAMTYVTFGCLSVLTVALAMRDDARGLATLLSPAFVLFGGWVLMTAVLSFDPATSVKRLTLTLFVAVVTASLMLLPKSQRELVRWLTIASLALLAICYLGILLAPDLSIHLATDAQEPGLAGNWRGAFGHKNQAAAIMVMVLFLGIYAVRSGLWISGAGIIVLASLFLLYSAGKSSLTLCFAVLLLTSATSVIRSFWLRSIVLLTPLLLLNLLSVGTVLFEGLSAISSILPFDSTFTGRTDIWAFALQSLKARLLTGYGFASFWGSSAIQNLPEGKEWAGFAAHSHNGYLDTTLGMGIPGLILLVVVLVIVPLRNFQKAYEGGNDGPLAMALLRIWLFGLYLSAMESFFLDRADPLWIMFLMAVFGLHYLARFRAAA
ncbi:MAG: O-antigen ligase [bacterium]|nr:O-antigen ligase [bacterium]